MGSVYLLHLERPLKHARHYIGWATHVKKRLAHHRAGSGAKFTRAAMLAGIGFDIARVWKGADRAFERKLKKWKKSSQLCPVCKADRQAAKSPTCEAVQS